MANLLDLMSKEDREKSLKRFEERLAKREDLNNKISNEVFLLSEFGYYYGYQAILDARSNKISLEEVYALVEGARKVWYQKLVEQSKVAITASSLPFAKNAQKAYKDGIGEFIKRSKING